MLVTPQKTNYSLYKDSLEKTFFLPNGLFGIENIHEYRIQKVSDTPFYDMQATQEDYSFFLINPYFISQEFELNILPHDYQALGSPAYMDLIVFSIVTLNSDVQKVSCNLLGPLVINTATLIARQCINQDEKWVTKHSLLTGKSLSSTL